MAIPLFYNLRNLMIRKTTTVMTGLGITLSVAVLVASLALVNGLRSVFASTGHPPKLLVLRKAALRNLAASSRRNLLQHSEAIDLRKLKNPIGM